MAEYVAEMTRGAMDAAWRRDMLKLELHAAFPPEAADKPNKQMAALAAAAAANAAAGKVKIDEKDIMLLVRKVGRCWKVWKGGPVMYTILFHWTWCCVQAVADVQPCIMMGIVGSD